MMGELPADVEVSSSAIPEKLTLDCHEVTPAATDGSATVCSWGILLVWADSD